MVHSVAPFLQAIPIPLLFPLRSFAQLIFPKRRTYIFSKATEMRGASLEQIITSIRNARQWGVPLK